MRVEVTRSGGVAAVELGAAVDSDQLPAEEADRLRALVREIDLDELAQRSPLRGSGADRFQYDLVVSDKGKRHEISASENAAPPQLRALIDWVRARGDAAGGQRPAS